MNTKLLLTGFNPFGGYATNISEALVRAVESDWPADAPAQLTVAVLPTEFAAAGAAIVDLIRTRAPDAIVCCGLADGDWGLRFELVARNRDSCGASDNAGDSRVEATIDHAGPAQYAATLPYHQVSRALAARKIPHEYSDDAGGFVCNHVFYRACREIAHSGRAVLCGFIHFPGDVEPDTDRGLPLATSLEALRVCLDEIAQYSGRAVHLPGLLRSRRNRERSGRSMEGALERRASIPFS
jgi:pyroglutamyl-peptidase